MIYNSDEFLHVRIDQLQLDASIGIYPAERQQRQSVLVDVSWTVQRSVIAKGDVIESTTDYDLVVATIKQMLTDRHFNLLETLVISIEQGLRDTHQLESLRLSVNKISAIPEAGSVSVSNYKIM